MSCFVERYQQGLRSLGIWFNIVDFQIVEIVIVVDFDWVCIDFQYGFVEMVDLL